MDQKYLSEIKARHEAATPGPYMWDVSTGCKQIMLETTHSGRYYVMGFERWGMQDAAPMFQQYGKYSGPVTERHSVGMIRADKLAKSYPGKEHHKGFDDFIDHPDAIALEKSWEDVDNLLAEVEWLTQEDKKAQENLIKLISKGEQKNATLKNGIEAFGKINNTLTAQIATLKKQINLMAKYIVEQGNVDINLCDDIPNELHLKYQPQNDGNYPNEPCIQCVQEHFRQQAEQRTDEVTHGEAEKK